MTFVLGLFLGSAVGIGAGAFLLHISAVRELTDREGRRRELLRQAENALSRYGESRHLAVAIRRLLAEEGGA